jgi:hypothetical protein
MRAQDSLELPPSFIRELVQAPTKKNTVQHLRCVGFILSSEFPNNLALIQKRDLFESRNIIAEDFEVVYCTHFVRNECAGDKDLSTYSIFGYRFSQVKSMFADVDNSARIGQFTVSNLDVSCEVVFPAIDLVSKCFIQRAGRDTIKAPSVTDPLSCDPDMPRVQSELRKFRDKPEKMEPTKHLEHLEDIKKRRQYIASRMIHNAHQRFNFWYIESTENPGRAKNLFQ